MIMWMITLHSFSNIHETLYLYNLYLYYLYIRCSKKYIIKHDDVRIKYEWSGTSLVCCNRKTLENHISRRTLLLLTTVVYNCQRLGTSVGGYISRIFLYICTVILLFLPSTLRTSNSFQSQWPCARAQILKLARWHVPFVRFRARHVSFQLKWTHVEQCSALRSVLTPSTHTSPPPPPPRLSRFFPTRLFSEWYRPICFRHLSNRTIPGLPLFLVPTDRVVQLIPN